MTACWVAKRVKLQPELWCCVQAVSDVSVCACCCRLINVDIYSFDFKLNHIAKHLKLPSAATMGPAAQQLLPNERLPPIVLINLQLPTYPVCCM